VHRNGASKGVTRRDQSRASLLAKAEISDNQCMRKLLITAGFFVCALTGMWLNERSWNGQVFVYMGRDRGPASVKSVKDYTALPGTSLSASAASQLLADANLVKESGYVGVQLGQVLMQAQDGEVGHEFACEVGGRPGIYDRVELTFMGEGIAEGDTPPKMVVDAKCRAGNSMERLETVWIPMEDMLSLKPKNQDLRSRGEEPTFIKLQAMPSSWPESWTLYQVRLYRESGGGQKFFKIDSADMLKGDLKRLGFDWKK
jgi:hypothetical protein